MTHVDQTPLHVKDSNKFPMAYSISISSDYVHRYL